VSSNKRSMEPQRIGRAGACETSSGVRLTPKSALEFLGNSRPFPSWKILVAFGRTLAATDCITSGLSNLCFVVAG
jgi:hypothetical protein